MKSSLKDIAKACNVSTTTVSLVLNDKPNRISEETKAIIKKVALEMNYRPNLLSRSLVTKQLGIIGFIVPTIRGYLHSEYTHEVINSLEGKNFNVLLSMSNSDPLNEKEALLRFLDYGVDGLIISRAYSYDKYIDIESLDILSSTKTPFILAGPLEMETDLPSISVDNRYSGYIAVRHLLDLGHKKIAFMMDDEDIFINNLRLEGYRMALEEMGIIFDEEILVESSYAVNKFTLDYLMSKGVSAIITANDKTIISIYQRAKEINIGLPDDLSIISFTNSYTHDFLEPGITSIVPPIKLIANDISNTIINLINGNNTNQSIYYYKPELILRNSTTRPSIVSII